MLDVNRTGNNGEDPLVASLSVHDAATFSTLIRNEKQRADRDGGGFCLLVVDFGGLNAATAERRLLTDRLRLRLRSFDCMGRTDEGGIGVLLPSTSFDGAKTFAERLFCENGERRYAYRVYAYPWHKLPIGSGSTAALPERGSAPSATAEELSEATLPPMFCITMPTWKRCLDIVASLLIFVITLPLFLLVALYIKSVSPGPVFYRQLRVGYRGKAFTFIKFRTMKFGNNEALHKSHIVARLRFNEPLEKLDDKGDPRIIRGGRVLRRTCVDELPQLLNVFRGEMSLVGPRPCLPYEAAEFLRWHAQRFDVVPGMTGLWQISGKNKLSLLEMIRLDITYARDMSLGLDLKIIALTIPAVLRMVVESIAKRLTKPDTIR